MTALWITELESNPEIAIGVLEASIQNYKELHKKIKGLELPIVINNLTIIKDRIKKLIPENKTGSKLL